MNLQINSYQIQEKLLKKSFMNDLSMFFLAMNGKKFLF